MANQKPKGTQRRKVLCTLKPENDEYLNQKAELFQSRGGRGGKSEALNRMIEFVRGYEERMGS